MHLRFSHTSPLFLPLWLLTATLLVGSPALSIGATRPVATSTRPSDSRYQFSFVSIDSEHLVVLVRPTLPPATLLAATVGSDVVSVSAGRSGMPVRISGRMSVGGSVDRVVQVVVSSGTLNSARQRDIESVISVLATRFTEDTDRFHVSRVLPGGILDAAGAGNWACIPLMSGCRADDGVESALNRAVATMLDEASGLSGRHRQSESFEPRSFRAVKDLILVSDGMTGDATRFADMTQAELLAFEDDTRLAVERTAGDIIKHQISVFVLPLPGTDAVGMARLKALATLTGGLFIDTGVDLAGAVVRLDETVNGGSLVRIPVEDSGRGDLRLDRVVFEGYDGYAGDAFVMFPAASSTREGHDWLPPAGVRTVALTGFVMVVASGCLCVILSVVAAQRRSGRSGTNRAKRSVAPGRFSGWAKY